MHKILMLVICGIFIAGCNDYVSKKREGLKPYHHADDTQQAEEAKE